MTESAQPLLEARRACKYYLSTRREEVRALDEVDLTIGRHRFAAIIGQSGSGKSTLLSILGVLDRPTRGQVLFVGSDLGICSDVALARIRRRVGFIFQNFSLLPRLTVWENVTYPLVPRGVRAGERRERATRLLARCGVGHKMASRPEELSGGEQQRVAVARALASDPRAAAGRRTDVQP
jgi:putative ABC transport system ATP-binding protein